MSNVSITRKLKKEMEKINNETKVPDISVVILCYREGRTVVGFILEMKRLIEERGLSYELIPVANYYENGGQKDKTPDILKELAKRDSHIIPVSKEKHGGFGWDVRSGLSIARGETVAFIDGDGQMPANDVVRVYDELVRTGSDVVQTFRVKRLDTLQRVVISRIYNMLLKILFPRVTVFDANSKPKIFTRESLEKLTLVSSDWFIDAEVLIQATEQNFKISQIPTVFHKNKLRPSYVRLGAIFEFIKNLISYRFRR
ncbi:glycosyltransferase family 2 protein [Patescibacteria group bacterium]|nr:MAG: glycosyltransferase family 2 protein [Patescibacteria group bacterium]